MKTAISVNDELVREADRVAREIGVSRSRLFSLALQDYLRQRRNDCILEQLNRVYAGGPTKAEKSTLARMKAKFQSTIRDRW